MPDEKKWYALTAKKCRPTLRVRQGFSASQNTIAPRPLILRRIFNFASIFCQLSSLESIFDVEFFIFYGPTWNSHFKIAKLCKNASYVASSLLLSFFRLSPRVSAIITRALESPPLSQLLSPPLSRPLSPPLSQKYFLTNSQLYWCSFNSSHI